MDLISLRNTLGRHEPRLEQEAQSWAAVAAVFRQGRAGLEVFLIRRAEHPSDPWSGHMAFPGGRLDAEDAGLVHTVHRETREEVGLDLERSASLLGQLDDMRAVARGKRTGLVVRPFVFELTAEVEFTHDATEVAESLWAPIAPLIAGDADTTRPYEFEGRRVDLPAYDVDGRVVWGLTYQMLRSFFDLVSQPR